jgi:hypothetical protein
MDFVVSKVAMAICALLVVAVLAGVFSEGALVGRTRGFEHILNEFCDLIERACAKGSEGSIAWSTPFLQSGESVTISIHKGTVLLESAEGSDARRPSHGLHLWHSDGRPLNLSMVEALDECAGCLTFESGQDMNIVAESVTFENERHIFVFVYPMG